MSHHTKSAEKLEGGGLFGAEVALSDLYDHDRRATRFVGPTDAVTHVSLPRYSIPATAASFAASRASSSKPDALCVSEHIQDSLEW